MSSEPLFPGPERHTDAAVPGYARPRLLRPEDGAPEALTPPLAFRPSGARPDRTAGGGQDDGQQRRTAPATPGEVTALDEVSQALARRRGLRVQARPGITAPAAPQASAASPTQAAADQALPFALVASISLAVAEALTGARPLHQLSSWLDLETHAKLTRRVGWERRAAPLRPDAVRGRRPNSSARALRPRLCGVSDGVVEASCSLVVEGRVRALALRLEVHRGRWRAVALELG